MTLDLTTPNLADACQRLGLPVRHVALVPLVAGMRVSGPARPAVHRGSVDVFFRAMTEAAPGEVLVIDNEGRLDEGCIGDLTVLEAQAFGMAGVIVFGAHRDAAELREIALPVFSRGACAVGPRALRTRDDQPCRIGDEIVTTDDHVFADDDGALFVHQSVLPDVLQTARAIRDTERRQAELVRRGTNLHQQFQWDAFAQRSRERADYTFREHLRAIGRAIE